MAAISTTAYLTCPGAYDLKSFMFKSRTNFRLFITVFLAFLSLEAFAIPDEAEGSFLNLNIKLTRSLKKQVTSKVIVQNDDQKVIQTVVEEFSHLSACKNYPISFDNLKMLDTLFSSYCKNFRISRCHFRIERNLISNPLHFSISMNYRYRNENKPIEEKDVTEEELNNSISKVLLDTCKAMHGIKRFENPTQADPLQSTCIIN